MVDKKLENFRPMQVSYRKASENKKCSRDRESKRGSRRTTSESLDGKKIESLSSVDFSDEDFIVFCFREDGAIRKPEADHGEGTKISTGARPNSRKNHDHNSREEERSIYPRNEEDSHTFNKKEKAKSVTSLFSGESFVKEIEKQKVASASESSNSNQSDGSSGSFAFPILSWEGEESPAQMPKPETLQFWRHKKWAVLCLCNRF